MPEEKPKSYQCNPVAWIERSGIRVNGAGYNIFGVLVAVKWIPDSSLRQAQDWLSLTSGMTGRMCKF